VSTLAGDGTPGDGQRFNLPTGIAVDNDGAVFVADTVNQRICLVAADGTVTTWAESTAGAVFAPSGIAVAANGDVYLANKLHALIHRITPAGTVTNLAGNWHGFADGVGPNAQFDHPLGIAVDENGTCFVGDTLNHRIRRVLGDGTTSTLAGNGTAGATDGQVGDAHFHEPGTVARDEDGTLYIADSKNHQIRKVTTDGFVTTLAGTGMPGWADSAGDTFVDAGPFTAFGVHYRAVSFAGQPAPGNKNGLGSAARFNRPRGITIDGSGNLYVADTYNHAIRKITPDGLVSTLAGGAAAGYRDGRGSQALFNEPAAVEVDDRGVVYVADSRNNRIRRITADGNVTTLAGSVFGRDKLPHRHAAHDGIGVTAVFVQPEGLALDSGGNLYVADTWDGVIRLIDLESRSTRSLSAGSGYKDNQANDWDWVKGPLFALPRQLAVDANGDLFIADSHNNRIRKMTASGEVTTYAGSGPVGTIDEDLNSVKALVDGPADEARFFQCTGVAVDATGNLYVADTDNQRIRMITPARMVSTVAGTGHEFQSPYSIAIAVDGTIYVSDSLNHQIFKLDPAPSPGVIAPI
jgi:sugar lactone lactonase YvrE